MRRMRMMRMAGDVHVHRLFTTIFILTTLFLSTEAVTSDDLFGPGDGVTILSGNTTQVQNVLADRSHMWMVNFYSSWCGHCIRFAPVLKNLAASIKDWSGVVQLATLNCGSRENLQTCTDYGITGYPTLRIIPAYSPRNTTGENFSESREGVKALEKGIIHYFQKNKSGVKRMPHLQQLNKLEDIWEDVGPHTKHTVIIFEEASSLLGRKVILDLSSRDDVVIRRMLEEDAEKYAISKYPSMYLINKSGNFDLLKSEWADHRNYSRVLWNLLKGEKSAGITNPTTVLSSQTSTRTPVPSSSSISVHEQDLLSALSYSLKHEIAVQSTFSQNALVALKAYVQVLSKYFPSSHNSSTVTFLHNLHTWLQDLKGSSLTGAEWLKQLASLETREAHIPDTDEWKSCLGSQPHYRGYPCGMWLLFHTLTVSAAEYSEEASFEPKEVLFSMRSYIQEFFGCRECVKNFAKGAVYIEEVVTSADSAILFLWRSHNKANFHLHGDETEDPAHLKIQFPSRESCPLCHIEGAEENAQWDEGRVLVFLKTMYGRHTIQALQKDVGLSGRIARVRERETRKLVPSGGAASIFSSMDVSVCALFYCVCVLFIFLLYYHFIIRRRMKICPSSLLL